MTHSSPENFDDTNSASNAGPFETPLKEETPDPTEGHTPSADQDNGADSTPVGGNTSGPVQKRRRVTRACDECRRKKIKCDGKQPCNHCVVYGYECTYDQPSNRRRNNATPQYVEALETQLKRARALLNAVLPQNNIDLNDPSLDARLQSGRFPAPQPLEPPGSAGSISSTQQTPAVEPEPSEQIESMVRSTGNLELDDDGKWDYHGHSSGLSFIRRMREHLGDVMGPVAEGHATPFVKSRPMSVVFDSPRSNQDSPLENNIQVHADAVELPSREVALRVCECAINDANSLLRILHAPSFFAMLNKIYDTPPESYGNEENIFMPLLYAVLALGSLFSKNHQEIDKVGYETAIDEGFKYFKASRQLMDIADCRDLTSLQAVLFMILFLQSSAKLATCYSYIGVALRSALRMGMHRSFNANFNPIEAETRKRCFWVIRRMDIYVGALLGLPYTLSDSDIDQDQPTEVDDEFITDKEILPMPEGRVAILAASNAHTRLVMILGKIVRTIYPIKGTAAAGEQGLCSKAYSISLDKIREIEGELQRWLDELHPGLKPGGDSSFIMKRCQQILRMAFAHAQMMLYRPFTHFVSKRFDRKELHPAAYACAAAGISVSRNIIHITVEMKKTGLLIGAYWFSMYTTFFAVMSLVYYVMENQDDPTTWEMMKDAIEGKEVLCQLAKRSMAADRCAVTLNSIFDRIPEHLKKPTDFVASKKRRQNPLAASRSVASQPEIGSDSFGPMRRANTFPEPGPAAISKRSSFPPAIAVAQAQNSYRDSPYQESPQTSTSDIFDNSAVPTPLSASTASLSFGLPSHSANQQFSQQQQQGDDSFGATNPSLYPGGGDYGGTIPDMTAIMFPSPDPFSYPNQPMTTFENVNNSEIGNNASNIGASHLNRAARFNYGALGSSHSPAPGSIPTSSAAFSPSQRQQTAEDIQLYGTMPMYLMPHQSTGLSNGAQAHPHSFMNSGANHMGNIGVINGDNKGVMSGGAVQMPQQRQQFLNEGEVDAVDMFGSADEWPGPFMDQGFGFGFGSGAEGVGMGFR